MGKTAKQMLFDLDVKGSAIYDDNYKKPLIKILLKFHNKCIDNYLDIISSIPGNIPLELKKDIVSFL